MEFSANLDSSGIDLAVRDPRDTSRYILGIECDGATYHSARTARDRDILRQQVLESMGWRIHRIWSTDCFRAPNCSIEGVLSSLRLAEAHPVEESVQGVPLPKATLIPPESQVSPHDTENTDPPPIQRRYMAGTPYHKLVCSGQRELLTEPRCSSHLSALIVHVVEAEYPIHEDFLTERLKEICGIARTGRGVASNIAEGIHFAIKASQIERRRQKDFLWKTTAQMATFRLPSDSARRPLNWIHREEIALAILYLVEDQFGVPRFDLGRAVARTFGIERASAEDVDYVLEVADELVEQNRLHRTDGRIVIGE